jgi:hypothetical protein
MTRPGVEVTIRDLTPARSAPVGIDTWFVVGLSERGPDTPQEILGLGQFETVYGERIATSVLYDAAETFFREGGSRMVVQRAFGPAPVKATVVLQDTAGTPAPCVNVTAAGAGSYGNDLDVQVVAGSSGALTVIVIFDDDVEVERSGDLATKQDAINFGATSDYVTITSAGATTLGPKVVAKTPLAGGTDDAANATDATWKTALDKLLKDWGPGQISMPGRSTSTAHTDLLAHAAANNRVALLDAAVAADYSALLAVGAGLQSNANARYGALFAPWAIIPGLTDGTTRQVPFSSVEAALMAQVPSGNIAAAGMNGQAKYTVDITTQFTNAQRQALMLAGVNTARVVYGGVRAYGYRTLADPDDLAAWLGLNGLRLIMDVKNQAEIIAEEYVFRQIDGQGKTLAALNGHLVGMLVKYYDSGALYGATFEDAAFVDTGNAVNTPETIAAGEIHALIGLKTSPFGELVVIDIVKVGINEVLAV